MMGRNHLISGAATLVTVECSVEALAGMQAASSLSGMPNVWQMFVEHMQSTPLATAVGITLYFLGCVLPDIDSKSSMIGKHLHLKIGHRTWTHSIWPVIGFGIIGIWVPVISWLAFGYFVHLFWDSFSRMGICWLYPHPGYIEYDSGAKIKRGNHIWFYRAKSKAETVVTVFSWVPAVFAMIALSMVV